MRYAIIQNNRIQNIVIAEKNYAEQQGWVLVEDTVGIGYEFIDGSWVNPNPITIDLALSVRTQRNILLEESDWTQLSDTPVNKQAWVTYRQELRDIPNQSGFPSTIVWPLKPE
jgi:hypothetical protein